MTRLTQCYPHMHAHRINLIALAGSLVVALAALAADASIEERARVGGGWNLLYLVAPALHVLLACMSLATLAASLRRRVFVEPLLVTAMVVLIAWAQVEAGVSRFHRYSTRPNAGVDG